MTLALIVAALATWRISSMLVNEAGPFHVFENIRSWASTKPFWAELLGCIWCCSVYIGAAAALLVVLDFWFGLVPFALSALAIGFETWLSSTQV